jgi:hypothetical protein
MKKVLIIATIFLGAMFGMNQEASAQCNSELYVNKSMKELAPGFSFYKSYRIDGRNGTRRKVEYTCVFSKDSNYQLQITGKDGGAQGLIGTLYDSRRNKIVTSYYNNKFLPSWTYKCRATGIYYLTFTFKDSKSYCGAAVLGFKR